MDLGLLTVIILFVSLGICLIIGIWAFIQFLQTPVEKRTPKTENTSKSKKLISIFAFYLAGLLQLYSWYSGGSNKFTLMSASYFIAGAVYSTYKFVTHKT